MVTVLLDVISKHVIIPSSVSHSNPGPQPQSENSQSCPVYSGGHVHMKLPFVLVQVPPFKQVTEMRMWRIGDVGERESKIVKLI